MRKSKEELISELEECYEKHGKINRRIFNDDKEFSSGKTVYNRFGSFSGALEQEGLPHYHPQKKDKEEVTCKNCGETIQVYPYRLKNTEKFFCNYDCEGEWLSNNIHGENHPLYKGGGEWKDKMGSRWHIVREKCLERDDYKCKFCEKSESEHIEEYGRGLEVHHIEPRRKFYNDEERSLDEANKMSNLITLCSEHHRKAEEGIIEVEV